MLPLRAQDKPCYRGLVPFRSLGSSTFQPIPTTRPSWFDRLPSGCSTRVPRSDYRPPLAPWGPRGPCSMLGEYRTRREQHPTSLLPSSVQAKPRCCLGWKLAFCPSLKKLGRADPVANRWLTETSPKTQDYPNIPPQSPSIYRCLLDYRSAT